MIEKLDEFKKYGVYAFVVLFLVLTLIWSGVWYGVIGSGVATLSATLILILITGAYAILTFNLWRETHKDRQQRVNPTLWIVKTDSGPPDRVSIKNLGNGPALNLTVEVELGPSDGDGPSLSKWVGHLKVDETFPIMREDLLDLQDRDSELYEDYDRIVASFEYINSNGVSYEPSTDFPLNRVKPLK